MSSRSLEDLNQAMKIAICPGHHAAAKGAVSRTYKVNEYDEAAKVIPYLTQELTNKGYEVEVITGLLSKKIKKINAGGFALAIDLHFNAGGGQGCEVIYCPNSAERARQAGILSAQIASVLGTKDRGGKEGWYQSGDNPGTEPDAFVSQTSCPAFIPEPLFIDNDEEVAKWLVGRQHATIARAIAKGIVTVIGTLNRSQL